MQLMVSSPSRVHVSLLDLSGDLGYLDGGVGFAVKFPRTVVYASPSDKLEVLGPRSDLVLNKLRKLGLNGKVEIASVAPPHMGFGSTTQLLLTSLKALCELNAVPCNSREMALLVGRGGTSGIGTAVFENGGFIADFGHETTIKGSPKPSGVSSASPPSYLRLPFPEDWWVVIAYPKKRRGIYDEITEVEEFKKRTPIPPEESAKAVRIAYMLIIAGIAEKNYARFAKGINEIQKVGFKRIEVEIQPAAVTELMEEMRKIFGNSGLSSMGQAVYSIVLEKHVRKKLSEINFDGFDVIVTPADNTGAKVSYR